MEKSELTRLAREFIGRKTTLTLERYNQIRVEWDNAVDCLEKEEITREEVFKLHKSLSQEIEKASIKFENENDFIDFTKIMIGLGAFGNASEAFLTIEHEIEHTRPYRELGIGCYLGWRSFSEPNTFQGFQQPFGQKFESLSSLNIAKLFYKSLNAVSKPSVSDENCMILLKEKWGENINEDIRI